MRHPPRRRRAPRAPQRPPALGTAPGRTPCARPPGPANFRSDCTASRAAAHRVSPANSAQFWPLPIASERLAEPALRRWSHSIASAPEVPRQGRPRAETAGGTHTPSRPTSWGGARRRVRRPQPLVSRVRLAARRVSSSCFELGQAFRRGRPGPAASPHPEGGMSGVLLTTLEGRPIRKGDVVVCRWDDDAERESPFASRSPPHSRPAGANRGQRPPRARIRARALCWRPESVAAPRNRAPRSPVAAPGQTTSNRAPFEVLSRGTRAGTSHPAAPRIPGPQPRARALPLCCWVAPPLPADTGEVLETAAGAGAADGLVYLHYPAREFPRLPNARMPPAAPALLAPPPCPPRAPRWGGRWRGFPPARLPPARPCSPRALDRPQ